MNHISNAALITVIVPAYNHEKYIEGCLQSLINQTYPNLQLIVINDGSTDSTHDEIAKLEKKCKERFCDYQYISKKNEGITKTLNLGIEMASGDFILTIASDDKTANNDAIELLYHEMVEQGLQDPNLAVVCGEMGIIDGQDKNIYWTTNRRISYTKKNSSCYDTTTTYFTQWRKEFDGFDYLGKDFGSYKTLIIGHYMPNGCLIKKSALIEVGCYTENICVEDWDLWLKLSKKYSFRFINKILFLSRWHETNSQKIRDREIRRDIYKLILNEKNYCHHNGMEKIWDTAFRLSRSGLVANGDLKFLLIHTSNNHMKYLPLDVMLFGLHSVKKILRLILSNEDFDSAKKVARKLIKKSN